MIVTIHQPEHLPYFGLLDKINQADIYVVLDDVDYKKQNFQNRNRISTRYGPKWLTIPVKNFKQHINKQETVSSWKEDYRNKVIENYKKHPYFDQGLSLVDSMLSIDSNLLIDYNLKYLRDILRLLDIKTQLIISSELKITTNRSQKLLDICKKLNATQYLAGSDAKSYMDFSIFHKEISIITYQSRHDIPKPFMSSLDFIMCIGIDNFKMLLKFPYLEENHLFDFFHHHQNIVV